jgi:hypothetical protein
MTTHLSGVPSSAPKSQSSSSPKPTTMWNAYIRSGSELPLMLWAARKQRRAANAGKRAMGWKLPHAKTIHYVRLTATKLPKITPSLLSLTCAPDACWIRSLRAAKALVSADLAAGGSGSLDTFEHRRCQVCARVLVGSEATDYRERLRWPQHKWYWPWGPCCSPDCKPTPQRAARAIAGGQTRLQRVQKEWSA